MRGLETYIRTRVEGKTLSPAPGLFYCFYIFVVLVCLYIAIRLIPCLKSKGTCRIVAGAIAFHCTTDVNPGSAGSGNVVNINIKAGN